MPRTTIYQYRVIPGTNLAGPFPLDMLRRDRSWPASTVDAIKLAFAITGSRDLRAAYGTDVTITLHGLSEPNSERWASYGWLVTDYGGIR